MDYRHTKHQVARGALADMNTYDELILIKLVSEMRLTYQIKMLTFQAIQEEKKLIIELPKYCKIHKSLKTFIKMYPKSIKIERT